MESSWYPRRQLPRRNYLVPAEDPLEFEASDSDQSQTKTRKLDAVISVFEISDDDDDDDDDDNVVVEDFDDGDDDGEDNDESDKEDTGCGDSDIDEAFVQQPSLAKAKFQQEDTSSHNTPDEETSLSDGEDDEQAGKRVNDRQYLARIKDKLTRWGAFDKDWSKITDLEQFLRSRPQKGISQLKDLIADLHRGISIKEFEERIPSAQITKCYWSLKNDLERLAGKKVVLLIGFCPQYNITLNGNSAEVAPEDSECLTRLILSWLSKQSDGSLLAWDFRHDCRKNADSVNSNTVYAKCAPIDNLKTEVEQLNYLSYILLLAAQKLYSIEIQGTISFSACTNHFVRILDVPHINLGEHISRISRRSSLAVDLAKGMADSHLYGERRWQDLYSDLAKFLALGPGRESGRTLVRLPPAQDNLAPPITFDDLISSSTMVRKDYGRKASTKSRQRTKKREAEDPEYAKKRKAATKGYKITEYDKIKKMRVDDPEAYRAHRAKMSDRQRKLRAKNPGYSDAQNKKVAKKRLDDPEYDEMFRERKKRINKKAKDKLRGNNMYGR